MTRRDEDGDLAGTTPADGLGFVNGEEMTNPTAPSDADLIARLRAGRTGDGLASSLDREAADRIEALSTLVENWRNDSREETEARLVAETRLAEVERQRDHLTAELRAASESASSMTRWGAGHRDRADRAEQCIEQVRALPDQVPAWKIRRDTLAAYDAARETPAPAEPEDEK